MDESKHLDQFNGSCSILVSNDAYRFYFRGQEEIGRIPDSNDPHGSMFVSTSSDIDKAIKESNGDISRLESSLGFPEGHFGNDPIVRVDICNPEDHGLRMATGREAGANEFFNTPLDEHGNLPVIQYSQDCNGKWCVDTQKTDPGELQKLNGQYTDEKGIYHPPKPEGYEGKTSGGLSEAVVNQVPNTPQNIIYTKIDGFHRGENSNISSTQISNGYASDPSPKPFVSSQNAASVTGGGANAPNGSKPDAKPQTYGYAEVGAGAKPIKQRDSARHDNQTQAGSKPGQRPRSNDPIGNSESSLDKAIPRGNTLDENADIRNKQGITPEAKSADSSVPQFTKSNQGNGIQ